MKSSALIIFAKQPVAGRVKTRLTPGLSPEDAAQLYASMVADTVDTARSIEGVDCLLFCEGGTKAERYFRCSFPDLPLFPQKGPDLGRRMEDAFSRTFSMGYRSVAIIGTDSPDLPGEFVEEAFRILADSLADVIFGPARDGGYYLLAMNRFHRELFHGISWSTGQVLPESLKKAESLGLLPKLLPEWHDIDTCDDLAGMRKRGCGTRAPRTSAFADSLRLP